MSKHEEELLLRSSQLITAKREELCARECRIAIEEDIAQLIPSPESGQKTIKLPDGSKLTVERGLIYKANVQDIRDVFSDIPDTENLFIPISRKVEEKLDVKGYEWYRKNYPQIFQELSEFVTITPKKISVSIQEPKV